MCPFNVQGGFKLPVSRDTPVRSGAGRDAIGFEDVEIRRRERWQAVQRREQVRVAPDGVGTKGIDDDDGLALTVQTALIERIEPVGCLHFSRIVAAGWEIGNSAGDVRAIAVAGVGGGRKASPGGEGDRLGRPKAVCAEEKPIRAYGRRPDSRIRCAGLRIEGWGGIRSISKIA